MNNKVFLTALIAATAVGAVALGEINIKLGDPVSQVLTTLGEPSATATKDGLTHYLYDGGDVIAKDGKVIAFPKNFEAESQRKQAEREAYRTEKLNQGKFAATQKANGLVLYEKQWVTPKQKADLEAAAAEVAAEKRKTKEMAAAAEEKALLETAAAKKKARDQAFLQGGLLYKNIVLSPGEYLGKELTLRGEFRGFYYRNYDEERCFRIEQDDLKIGVSYKWLPKEQQAKLLEQETNSRALVEVKGTLRSVYRYNAGDYYDKEYYRRQYYIQATSVSFYESR